MSKKTNTAIVSSEIVAATVVPQIVAAIDASVPDVSAVERVKAELARKAEMLRTARIAVAESAYDLAYAETMNSADKVGKRAGTTDAKKVLLARIREQTSGEIIARIADTLTSAVTH